MDPIRQDALLIARILATMIDKHAPEDAMHEDAFQLVEACHNGLVELRSNYNIKDSEIWRDQ